MGAAIRASKVDTVIQLEYSKQRKSRGAAAVELALLVMVLLLLAFGAADFGRILYAKIAMQGAANAGAEYGSRLTGAYADSAGIQSAALADTGGLSGVSVSSSATCFCSGGGTISCSGACGGATEVDPTPYIVLTVSTAYTFVPAVTGLSGLPSSMVVRGSVSMRAQ